MKDEDITATVAEPLLLGADYFTISGGSMPGSLSFVVSEHPLSILPPPAPPGVLVVDDVCSMIKTPTRTYRLTDSEGKPPPLVPTMEALEVWGPYWWGDGSIVYVRCYGQRICYEEFGDPYGGSIDGIVEWSGPVTERPKEKG